jgi:hypothetical protein
LIAVLVVIAILLALILFAILNRDGARAFLAGARSTAVWILCGAFAVGLLALAWFVFHSMTWDAMVLLAIFVGWILIARWKGRIFRENPVDLFADRIDRYFEKREKVKRKA